MPTVLWNPSRHRPSCLCLRIFLCLFLCLCLFIPVLAVSGLLGAEQDGAAPSEKGPLPLHRPRALHLELRGPVGDRVERNVDRWLLPAPDANPGMLGMFRVRDRKPTPSIVPWAGEFAGKYLISAVQALRMTRRKDLEDRVASFVEELIATQAPDGYLGPFPEGERLLGNWDLWGHYHVMQGLLLWHERTGDAAALDAATRAAELMERTYLDGARRVIDAGSPEMNMAAIHVLGWLYRLTGRERTLRLAREIEKDWERAGDYLRAGLAGTDFYRTPLPRWESLHGVQGLVELYRITGDDRYRTAFESLWRSIARRDRHNTGGFSTGEKAVGDPYAPGAIETCCTVAWAALSIDMLRLTGDPSAADELELSTFNAILGAQHRSGRWWTYDTPMDGVREASAHAIVFQARAGTPELNCCSVNGPRGLGMIAEWAFLADSAGIVVNYYGPCEATMELDDGTPLRIAVETEYPFGAARPFGAGLGPGPEPGADGGLVRIRVFPAVERRFALRLRIPSWARGTRIALPDPAPGARAPQEGTPEPGPPPPGTYHAVERLWRPGDELTVAFDLGLRVLPGDRAQRGRLSLYYGPVLLAYDQSRNPFDEDGLPRIDAEAVAGLQIGGAGPAGLERCDPPPPLLLLAVPAEGGRSVALSDFASAGAAGTRYRTWLPGVRIPPPVPLPDDAPPPRDDGLVLAAELRGKPDPLHGRLLDAEGWSPAEGPPHAGGPPRAGGPPGDAASAVALEKGRLRYALPWIPWDSYSAVVRVKVRAFPEGRIAQVFSAWAAGMDDPLRITLDGGRLFVRIEAGRAFSTEGVPIEAGRWMHVAAVKDGPRLRLHIDGEERAATDVPAEIRTAASSCALGANPNHSGDESLAASFSGFSVHARALSAEEVRALAAAAGDASR